MTKKQLKECLEAAKNIEANANAFDRLQLQIDAIAEFIQSVPSKR